MAQSCLKFLKYALITFNFIFWLCGGIVLALGIYLMMTSNYGSLLPNQPSLSVANTLIITGTIVMVVSFLGCLGSLKENKCLLITFFIILLILMMVEIAMAIFLLIYEEKIDGFLLKEFEASLQKYTHSNATQGTEDWDIIQHKGCYEKLKQWFEYNYLNVGIGIIVISVIQGDGVTQLLFFVPQVLGMSFAMTLYCHISKSGIFFQ
ncbi:UNVERIFIED_CONTAM: hypothetical protein FKN15_075434 [Acipenser sinensis]